MALLSARSHSCALKLNYEYKLQHWPYFETTFTPVALSNLYRIYVFIYWSKSFAGSDFYLHISLSWISQSFFSAVFFVNFSSRNFSFKIFTFSTITFWYSTPFNLSFSRFFEMIRNGFSLQHHLFSSFILSVILFSKSMERV